MTSGDTIAAIATAPGRSGVAVVRVSGPEAFAVAERLAGYRPQDSGMRFRRLHAGGMLLDEAVVLAFRGPRSYTGEDVVEFQCHGGEVVPRRVLQACLASGARMARRGEFTERAFLHGRIGCEQAEAVLDLVNARTDRAADAALAGLSGGMTRKCRGFYEAALELSTRIEHALDVDDGELPEDFAARVREDAARLQAEIAAAIRTAHEGRLLRRGALVALAGPPNAGKSSLLNALLSAERAIVSDVPGTTRDVIEEGMDLGGWPVRLADTAGLRETDDPVEAEGVRRSEALVRQADVVLLLGAPPESLAGAADSDRIVAVHAKCDLGRGEGLNVSAKTGEGLEELKRRIAAELERRADGLPDGGDDASGRLSALYAAQRALAPAADGALDLVLAGNAVRTAAERLGELVGAVYSDELLDNLFSRFCVGK